MPDADRRSAAAAAADAVAELWTDYKADGTREARERLILHYSPLVKFVAGRVAAGLPQNIEQADLVSYGIFGLIDAIDKFDPGPRLQVRDLRDLPHQGRDHRRAALDRLGAALGAGQGPCDRARVLEARERAAAQPRRRRGRGRARHDARASSTQTLSQISFTGLVALDELLAGELERARRARDASATRSPTARTTRSRRSRSTR